MVQEITEEYREVYENLEDLELNIKHYQEFLGSVQASFDECKDGCRDRFNVGRVLDASYIQPKNKSRVDDDEYIDSMLEGEITSSEIRRLTGYCRGIISEMRDDRQELKDELRRLEKHIGFNRHPKKQNQGYLTERSR